MKHRTVPPSLPNCTRNTLLRELRLLADVSLHEGSNVARISYSQLWKAERGYAQLAAEQETILIKYYQARIEQLLKCIREALGTEGLIR